MRKKCVGIVDQAMAKLKAIDRYLKMFISSIRVMISR